VSLTLHSKAPWIDNEGSIETATGRVIAYVHGPADYPCLDTDDTDTYAAVETECAANTKLIQHAPEVLLQLQYAVFLFTHGMTPDSTEIATMLSAIMLAGVPVIEPRNREVAELARIIVAAAGLKNVVEFALSQFCSPHDLDTDPSSRKLKEIGERALALVKGGVL
jgi:hypothetical protein